MKAGALIPCRKGSKGIPGKNFKNLSGIPLWMYSYNVAVESKIFEKIIISSDGGFNGIGPFAKNTIIDNERPQEYSTDEAQLDPLMIYYALKYPKIDFWCLLQPTSPFRSAEDIKESFKFIKMKKYIAVVGVVWNPIMGWVEKATKDISKGGRNGAAILYLIHDRPNRQNRDDFFLENGAIYWTNAQPLIRYKNRIGNPGMVKLYQMPPERSIEIDTEFDWFIAEKTKEYLDERKPA